MENISKKCNPCGRRPSSRPLRKRKLRQFQFTRSLSYAFTREYVTMWNFKDIQNGKNFSQISKADHVKNKFHLQDELEILGRNKERTKGEEFSCHRRATEERVQKYRTL
jgi:hypothetical protein